MRARLEALEFESLAGWNEDDHLAALRTFERSARALAAGRDSARPAQPPSPELIANRPRGAWRDHLGRARRAAVLRDAVSTFPRHSRGRGRISHRILRALRRGFEGRDGGIPLAHPGAAGRSRDLCPRRGASRDFPKGSAAPGASATARLSPMPIGPQIETERRDPLVWVRDAVEAFLIQVQGSAQVEFADGRRARLAYDGRNGLPYTSIGRILIEAGEIAESAMSLASLKAWLRERRERGLALMRRNRSFVFFKLVEDFDPDLGPVAGAGVALTPLRSIAVDRDDLGLWPAVLDRRRIAVGGGDAAPVPPADDRPGHRLGDCRTSPRRPILRQRRRGRRARRRDSASGRVRRAPAARRRAVKEAPPRPQRLRRLSDEEIALWTEVARSVARRRGAALPTPSKPVVAEPAPAPPPTAAEAPPSRPAKQSAPPLAPIERRLKRKLARGRGAIDAAIDLHGLTQAEAHQALRGFLRHSQARGARLVIVVTGKGGPLDEPGSWPHERGVLQAARPRIGCASPTCARSCSASRRPDARTAGRARSTCGSDGLRAPRREANRYNANTMCFNSIATNSKPGATNSKAAETKSKEIDRKSKPKTTKTKLDFLPQIEPFQGVALTFRARCHKVELPPSIASRAAPGLAPLAGRNGCRQCRSSESYSTIF